MAKRDDSPQERSTAQENHLTVVLDARAGTARVVSDGTVVADLVEATRRAQERGDIRLLAGRAA